MCLTEMKNHQELVRTEQDSSERKQEGEEEALDLGKGDGGGRPHCIHER